MRHDQAESGRQNGRFDNGRYQQYSNEERAENKEDSIRKLKARN